MNNNIVKQDNLITVAIGSIVFLGLLYYLYKQYKLIKKDSDTENDNKKNKIYPKCPDYWESIENGKCRNTHKIGKCRLGKNENEDTVDFKTDIFMDKKTGNYMKCKWSQECMSPWEGIDKLC